MLFFIGQLSVIFELLLMTHQKNNLLGLPFCGLCLRQHLAWSGASRAVQNRSIRVLFVACSDGSPQVLYQKNECGKYRERNQA